MDSTFYLGIKKILLAHEYVLDHAHRCEYRGERGSYGLVYVIRGEAKYIFSTGERVTLRPGDVFFISPKSAYSILCDGEFLHDTINFLLYETEGNTPHLPSPYLHLVGENTSGFGRMFGRIVSLWQKKDYFSADEAVIMKPVTSVKSSPSTEATKDLFILHEGTKVKVVDQVGSWNNIELADGRQGWLPSSDMELI